MKDSRRNEVTVGLTVLAGIAILAFGIMTFKEWSVTDAGARVNMRFPESAGLQIGDVVTLNGVNAGRVESIELEQHSVLVRVSMHEHQAISVDAKPVIQMLELMGGKKINIRQGIGRPATSDDILEGSVDPDISGALGMLGDAREEIDSMTRNAAALLASANRELSDTTMFADIRQAVQNVRVITAEVRSLLHDHSADVSRLAVRAVAVTERTDSLLAMLGPRLSTSLESAQNIMLRSDSLVVDVRSMLSDIRNSKGLINTVVHDTALVTRMRQMMDRVDTLAAVIVNGQMRIKLRL